MAPIFATLWRPITKGKGKDKRSPQGNSKEGSAPQGILCTKSMGGCLSTGTKERTMDVSTGMQKRECVFYFNGFNAYGLTLNTAAFTDYFPPPQKK